MKGNGGKMIFATFERGKNRKPTKINKKHKKVMQNL